MFRFLFIRLLSAAAVVVGVATLVFFFLHLTPGDPVEALLGEHARPADREALRAALGLNRPLGEQLVNWFANLAQLDLGRSLYSQRPVAALLAERLPATAELAVAALAVALVVALPLGVVAAMRRGGGWDRGAMGFSLLGASIPNFWLGPLLILAFSLGLGWFPVSGREAPGSLVLPAVTLGTALAAILARMVRGALIETLHDDYVRTARAKGLAEWAVVVHHALRNAALPVITLLGLQLGALLGGAVVTETVFAWPGLGQLLVEAIQRRDYPVVQGTVLLISVLYVAVNALTDVAYAWADPRVRL